jgi:glycosyltransferase AglE
MPEGEMHFLPKISVIVPAFNAQSSIASTIESLLESDYPRELFDIIIVDNMSTDNTREIAARFPVVLLEEKDIQSAYAARNKGISLAKGEVIAFTDSDCIVGPGWLRYAIEKMNTDSADLVGGRVELFSLTDPGPAELFDIATGIHNEYFIKEMHGAVTANLFVKSELFSRLGVFNGRLVSGEDLRWTQNAVKKGYRLSYSDQAAVWHSPRKLKSLLAKRFRDGRSIIYVKINMGLSILKIISAFPIWISVLDDVPKEYYYSKNEEMLKAYIYGRTGIFSVVYFFVKILCKLAAFLGILSSVFDMSVLKNIKAGKMEKV